MQTYVYVTSLQADLLMSLVETLINHLHDDTVSCSISFNISYVYSYLFLAITSTEKEMFSSYVLCPAT